MTAPLFTVTGSAPGRAYQAASTLADTAGTEAVSPGQPESGFGAMLGRAIQGAIDTGHAADGAALQAIGGHGNITQVVAALSKAELALQTTSAIRDKMVQAYQDIMRMPI